MRLLLTRPRSDDDTLPAMLEQHGHQVTHVPLLEVEFLPPAAIDATLYQAVVATSSNALRVLAPNHSLAHLPLYAVGAATARTGRDKGFGNITSGKAGASELAMKLSASLTPGRGSILYLRGEDVAFDLAASLREAGFSVDSLKTYKTVQATELGRAAIADLADGRIGGVVLLSPRTSDVYVHLARQNEIGNGLKSIAHFCLSDRVAAPLAGLGINIIHVPGHPNLQELVALIDLSATQSSPSG